MGARRKPRDSPDRASIVAWLIFLIGAAAFSRALFQEAERARTIRDRRAALVQTEPPAAPVAPATAPPLRPSPAVVRPSPASTRSSQVHSPTPPALEAPRDLLAPGTTTTSRRRRPARLAIIIDDLGNDLGQIERVSRLDYPLTIAVIPHLRHSVKAADVLAARGYEIMLHLPMEPLSYPRDDPGKGAILSGMGRDEIRDAVLGGLAAVPHVLGVNNHMGSRVTSDPVSMRSVLETIVGLPYFFVDSKTIDSSVAYDLARELRIPSAQRSVFLDDHVNRASVRRQLRNASRIALSEGQAIAIGHPHAITLELLAKELPALERQGIQLVFVSTLVS